MTLLDILVYFLASFAGSALNSVAGGGTFLTFPLLIFNGLSPLVANIMSTIGLWPGSVSSALAYRGQLAQGHDHLAAFRQHLKFFIAISMMGSCVGTALLLLMPERVFAGSVPWLLLFATLLFTFGGKCIGLFSDSAPAKFSQRRAIGIALQFAIGIYGGYFGAGIGILMLAMLQVMGLSKIHQMNAMKTILGSVINAVAVIVFIFSGKVIWPMAAVMIAGGIAGGWAGAKLALRIAPEKIRVLVSAIGFAMTAYFFLQGA